MKQFAYPLLYLLLLMLPQVAPAQSALLDSLDARIARDVAAWQTPGVAVLILQDDSIRFSRGYGTRELGTDKPVNPHTLFAVASNSKAFTATLLAMLVDKGMLAWDDRVVDHLPDFQLYDPWITREIRVRDLLCHRSGLPVFGGDHLWIGAPQNSREEIVRRLRYLEPDAPFRFRYQYNNLMFLVAGQLYSAVSGERWEDAVQKHIFDEIGMSESKTSLKQLEGNANLALPHEEVAGRLQVVEFDPVDNVAAAAAINSTVLDMAKWMQLNLNQGRWGDRQLVSEAQMRELQRIHTPIPVSSQREEMLGTQFLGYGLGWVISDYRGYKTVGHSGGLSGMISLQTMIPAKKLGVVVLTNRAPNRLISVITNRVLDAWLQVEEQTDWSGIYLDLQRKDRERELARETELQQQRHRKSKPSLDLQAYCGVYNSALSGQATLRLQDKKLFFYYNERHQGYLEHWHHDQFRVNWINPIFDMPKQSFLQFFLTGKGTVEKLQVRFYDPLDFQFVSATLE